MFILTNNKTFPFAMVKAHEIGNLKTIALSIYNITMCTTSAPKFILEFW